MERRLRTGRTSTSWPRKHRYLEPGAHVLRARRRQRTDLPNVLNCRFELSVCPSSRTGCWSPAHQLIVAQHRQGLALSAGSLPISSRLVPATRMARLPVWWGRVES